MAAVSTIIISVLVGIIVRNAVVISNENKKLQQYKSQLSENKKLIEEYTEQKEQALDEVRNEEIENSYADTYGKIGNAADEFSDVAGEIDPAYNLPGWAIKGLSGYAENYYREEDERVRQDRLQDVENNFKSLIDETSYNSEKLMQKITAHKETEQYWL